MKRKKKIKVGLNLNFRHFSIIEDRSAVTKTFKFSLLTESNSLFSFRPFFLMDFDSARGCVTSIGKRGFRPSGSRKKIMQTSAKSEKFNKVEHFILDCVDCGFGGRTTHEGQREVDGIGHTSAKRERFVVRSGMSGKKLFNFMLIFMFSVHIISYELRCWGSRST